MLVAVLSGYLLALFAPVIAWAAKRAAGPIIAALPAFLFAYLLQFVPEAALGRPWRFTFAWDAASGLQLSFLADGLSLLFGLLIALVGAASLIATAGLELAQGSRARLLLALLALTASALGVVFADQPVLLASFAAALSVSAFVAITAQTGAQGRVQALPILMLWLLADLALLLVLARLFADVPGGLLGAGGIASLAPNGRFEPAWLIPILALKTGPVFFALASRRLALLAPAASALAGVVVPASLYLLLRFAPVLPIEGRWALGILAGGGVLIGGLVALGAQRALLIVCGLTILVSATAALEIAFATDAALAGALLISATGALGLAALYLLAPPCSGREASLDELRGEVAPTPLHASCLIFCVLVLSGLVPSTGLLALLSSASAAVASDPWLAVPSLVLAFALGIGVALRFISVLVFGPLNETHAPSRLALVTAAAGLLVVAIVAGCAPIILARALIGPAIQSAVTPSLAVSGPAAWLLIAACLALGALFFWQRRLFARVLKWTSEVTPHLTRAPHRTLLLRLRGLARIRGAQQVPVLGVAAGVVTLAALGTAAIAWPHAGFTATQPDLVVAGLAATAAAASAIALVQRRFAQAVPILSIAGILSVLTALASGAVELGFVMLLVVVLETVILLVMSGRHEDVAVRPGSSRLTPIARAALAGAAGIAIALGAIEAGDALAVKNVAPTMNLAGSSGITGLIPAPGLALHESALFAIERWGGVVLILLILGGAATDLTSRTREKA
jgi:multicomponent Na+:H+ antiporter subunit A